nr:MAG TPA: protein of unknown function (DUF5055) [Caudoviricetes sp.]
MPPHSTRSATSKGKTDPMATLPDLFRGAFFCLLCLTYSPLCRIL